MFRDFVGSCHQQKIEASLVFDGLIEAIFILGMKRNIIRNNVNPMISADIFFNFHITYVNDKGEVVFDRKSIALKYLKGKQNRSYFQFKSHFIFVLRLVSFGPIGRASL